MKPRLFLPLAILVLGGLQSCITLYVPPAEAPVSGIRNPQSVRAAVIESARQLLGKGYESRATVRGKKFTLDCVGTVSAAWWGAGFDITRDFGKFSGNGVSRLVASLDAWGARSMDIEPRPGDFITWDNTWDRNEDGVLYNDGATHAGIVMSIDDDGTITYLHASVSRGVVLAFMNLRHPGVYFSPEKKVWNSPMMLGAGLNKANNPPRWLSGDLWSGFGSALRVSEVLPLVD